MIRCFGPDLDHTGVPRVLLGRGGVGQPDRAGSWLLDWLGWLSMESLVSRKWPGGRLAWGGGLCRCGSCGYHRLGFQPDCGRFAGRFGLLGGRLSLTRLI